MLRAKVLPEVLGQIIGDGIEATMLMTLDGALMGSVGDADVVDHKVVGAIASHTWGEYVHSAKEFNAGHALQTLLVELENGRLAMAAAGKGFVVCAYSSGEAEPGFIKVKVLVLST
ncbi:Ragulator complex protein lamtor2 isoform x1, partial [Globisporangium splendens]